MSVWAKTPKFRSPLEEPLSDALQQYQKREPLIAVVSSIDGSTLIVNNSINLLTLKKIKVPESLCTHGFQEFNESPTSPTSLFKVLYKAFYKPRK